MANVHDILKEKGSVVYIVSPQTTVYESLEKMTAHDVGSILVMENEKLLGIFTERDYMKKIVLQNRSSKTTPVRDVMTLNPVCITPEESIDNGLAIITQKRCRHLPVIDKEKVIGIVSIGDLVKKKISDLNATIKYLNDYITSQGFH